MRQDTQERPLSRLSAGELTRPVGGAIVDQEHLPFQPVPLEGLSQLSNEGRHDG